MTNHILAGLTKRRAELVTEVKKQEGVLRALLADVDHVDATIRQFDPAHRPRRPKTSIGRLERGAVTKGLLTILRTAPAPMTVRDLAVTLMTSRGMDPTDREKLARMVQQVRTAMWKQGKNGTATSELTGAALVWRVGIPNSESG